MYIRKIKTGDERYQWIIDDWLPLTTPLGKGINSFTYFVKEPGEYEVLICMCRIVEAGKHKYLEDVYVHEPYRRKGIGYEFLSKVLDKNKHPKVGILEKSKEITLKVYKDNLSAIKLYTKLGFEIYSEGVKWYLMSINP